MDGKGKFNFLHFLIFIGGIGVILLSLIYPWFQESFSSFWCSKSSGNIIVYAWLIALAYFYFDLLNTNTKQRYNTSRFVSADAIRIRALPVVPPAKGFKGQISVSGESIQRSIANRRNHRCNLWRMIFQNRCGQWWEYRWYRMSCATKKSAI